MADSASLSSFHDALLEIEHLEQASPTRPGGSPNEPGITRAVGRAGIVLLCSHFERYFYAVNEEAVAFLNERGPQGHLLPEPLRLLHSRYPIDDISPTGWENRTAKLASFVETDGWLWSGDRSGRLQAVRLLQWMTTPKPENLIRYYRYWGIQDVFSAVTRKPTTRSEFFLRIRGLVEKRNNIAHGDVNEQATPADVRRYARSVRDFCRRADRILSRSIAKSLPIGAPW